MSRPARRRARQRRRRWRVGLGSAAVLSLAGMAVAVAAAGGGRAPAERVLRPVAVAEASQGAPLPARIDPIRRAAVAATLSEPTPAAPLRMLVVGDSLGIDLGQQLAALLDGPSVSVTVTAQGDTGLANGDYFDWPAHLGAELAAERPQVVVVLIGANDDQGLSGPSTALTVGTGAWDAAYQGRVASMLAEARAAGARTVWVGMPAMATNALSVWMQHVDALDRAAVSVSPDSAYQEPPAALSAPSGSGAPLRTPDGVHLTPAGAGLLARAVCSTIGATWQAYLPVGGAPAAGGT